MKRSKFDILVGVLSLVLTALLGFLLSVREKQPIEIVRAEIESIIRKEELSDGLVSDLRNAVHEGDDAVLMTYGMTNAKAAAYAGLASLLSVRLIYSGIRRSRKNEN